MTYSTESVVAPPSVVVKMSRVDFRGRFLNLVLFLSREAHFFAELGGAQSCPLCPREVLAAWRSRLTHPLRCLVRERS